MAYQAPKGTRDVLPEESYRWQYIEGLIRDITKKYGLLEARTPVFEHTELFLRGVGKTTDIVQKEMYTFLDKGERSITLKPEGTAGIVRLFVEHNLYGEAQPTKMYYLNNPVFRYERPQAGRLREHHQFGVEIVGAPRPSAEAISASERPARYIESSVFSSVSDQIFPMRHGFAAFSCGKRPRCLSRFSVPRGRRESRAQIASSETPPR